MKKCNWCLTTFPSLVCSKCKNSYYCNKNCQINDWKLGFHNLSCGSTISIKNDISEQVKNRSTELVDPTINLLRKDGTPIKIFVSERSLGPKNRNSIAFGLNAIYIRPSRIYTKEDILKQIKLNSKLYEDLYSFSGKHSDVMGDTYLNVLNNDYNKNLSLKRRPQGLQFYASELLSTAKTNFNNFLNALNDVYEDNLKFKSRSIYSSIYNRFSNLNFAASINYALIKTTQLTSKLVLERNVNPAKLFNEFSVIKQMLDRKSVWIEAKYNDTSLTNNMIYGISDGLADDYIKIRLISDATKITVRKKAKIYFDDNTIFLNLLNELIAVLHSKFYFIENETTLNAHIYGNSKYKFEEDRKTRLVSIFTDVINSDYKGSVDILKLFETKKVTPIKLKILLERNQQKLSSIKSSEDVRKDKTITQKRKLEEKDVKQRLKSANFAIEEASQRKRQARTLEIQRKKILAGKRSKKGNKKDLILYIINNKLHKEPFPRSLILADGLFKDQVFIDKFIEHVKSKLNDKNINVPQNIEVSHVFTDMVSRVNISFWDLKLLYTKTYVELKQAEDKKNILDTNINDNLVKFLSWILTFKDDVTVWIRENEELEGGIASVYKKDEINDQIIDIKGLKYKWYEKIINTNEIKTMQDLYTLKNKSLNIVRSNFGDIEYEEFKDVLKSFEDLIIQKYGTKL